MPIHHIIYFPFGFDLFPAVQIPFLLGCEVQEIPGCTMIACPVFVIGTPKFQSRVAISTKAYSLRCSSSIPRIFFTACLERTCMDGIHVLRKLLRTVYGYVRFGSLQNSFQLQQYRVSRETDANVPLNAVAKPVVYRADSQVKLVETKGTFDEPQITI